MSLHAIAACVGGRYVAARTPAVLQLVPPPKPEPAPVDRFATLTPRERQTFEAYMRHGLCKLVAEELNMSERTVDAHLGKVLTKSGYSRTVLAALAYDRQQRAEVTE